MITLISVSHQDPVNADPIVYRWNTGRQYGKGDHAHSAVILNATTGHAACGKVLFVDHDRGFQGVVRVDMNWLPTDIRSAHFAEDLAVSVMEQIDSHSPMCDSLTIAHYPFDDLLHKLCKDRWFAPNCPVW